MNIQTFIANFILFLNNVVLPFLLTIAFVMFLWNAIRYFVIGGDSEGAQEEARTLTFWSISAFVVIISFWGIVNIFASGLGLRSEYAPVPDYMKEQLKDQNPSRL